MVDEQTCGQCKAIEMYRENHKHTDTPGRRIVAWVVSRADALKAGRRIT